MCPHAHMLRSRDTSAMTTPQSAPIEVTCKCNCDSNSKSKNEPEVWGLAPTIFVSLVLALLMLGAGLVFGRGKDGLELVAIVASVPTATHLLAKAATGASDFDTCNGLTSRVVYCIRDVSLGLALAGGVLTGAFTL